MIRIQLPKGDWEYDPSQRLGSKGGFGTVFAGTSVTGEPIAVKRLDVDLSESHRELRLAEFLENRPLAHVMPVLDAGQDADSGKYFIVMPRAEKSLQQELDEVKAFTDQEAVRILYDIALGLQEVGEVVHRDLKPGNVLYHEDRWKVADFGIARFVEEATSQQTLKGWWTPQYAAPEQWQMQRATSATDIYALGCIAYALLTGSPPFKGPSREDLREQHLSAEPSGLPESRPRLRTLVGMMLQKLPQSRPSLQRVIQILEDIKSAGVNQQGPGFQALSEAGALAMQDALHAEARRKAFAAREAERYRLAEGANRALHRVIDGLFRMIFRAAPAAQWTGTLASALTLRLGSAGVQVVAQKRQFPIPEGAFGRSGWDVVQGAAISVFQDAPQPYKWAANLWYTDLGLGGEYRWWEVGYWVQRSGYVRRQAEYEPFALPFDEEGLKHADLAASQTMHTICMAADPAPIDGEDLGAFCDRWARLLARACQGQLERPRNFPLSQA